MISPRTKYSPRGVSPKDKCGPPGKIFPRLVLGKKLLVPDVLKK
jgi:hypothetical protein